MTTPTIANAQLRKHLDERARLQSAECSSYESGERSSTRVVVNAITWITVAVFVLAVVIAVLKAWFGR